MKYKDGNQWVELTIKALDSMPIGCIILFAGSTIPAGWLKCEGQSLLRTEYSDLFGVINTLYGNVDSTHFNLPNYKGRVPVGLDSSDTDFDTLGETRGEKTHQLTVNEMPKHSHKVYYTDDGGQGSIARINVMGNQTSTTEVGGGQAHNNIQPSIVAYYIIKAKNTTPTMASIVDAYSTSTTDGYSANYVNNYINGSHIVYDQLLDNAVEVVNSGASATGNLNKSVSDYDMLIILIRGDWNHLKTIVIPKGLHGYAYDCYLFADTQYYFSGYVNCPSNTTVKITKASGAFSATVMQVYGIKFK